MNKKLIFAVTLVAVLALAVVGFASAQTPTPNRPFAPGAGYGQMGGGRGGMMGGAGGYGFMAQNNTAAETAMHDAMYNALAKGLGISRADLDARVAKGETPAQIATSKNLNATDFNKIWTDARKAGIDAAVASGTLTKEQAAWMLDRTTNRGNFGPGNCPYCTTPPTK